MFPLGITKGYIVEQDIILAKVSKLTGELDAIQEEIDALLSPLVSKVMLGGNIAEIEQLLYKLPTGYHKSELRAYSNNILTNLINY
jgi:hypothetical protein